MDLNLHLFKKNTHTHMKMNSFSPSQAEEDMNAAKNVYESINNELKDELPGIYDRSDLKKKLLLPHHECEYTHFSH